MDFFFLLNRTQAVKCNCNISCSSHVTSGVPQGSVIRPLLYTLFANDLPSVCYPCSIKMYANNIKIYYVIRHGSGRSVLQLCLNRICDWASKRELKFLFDKCQLLQIVNNKNISYNLGSLKISSWKSVVDFSVTIQSSLKSSLHCSLVAKKANIRAKLIFKSFLSRNSINYIRAFKCYVRPVLEYACIVWNSNLLQDNNLIENVQRRFTRNVYILCNIPILS